jgi:hypothetical protein
MSFSPINFDKATKETLIERIKQLEAQLYEEREEYKAYYNKTKYQDTNRTQELLKNNQILITENLYLKNKCQGLEKQINNSLDEKMENLVL